MLLMSFADFFQTQLFKIFFQEHYQSVKNGLDLDQDLCSVGPDLGSKFEKLPSMQRVTITLQALVMPETWVKVENFQ